MACSRDRAELPLPRAEALLEGRGLASERAGEALLRSRRGILRPKPDIMPYNNLRRAGNGGNISDPATGPGFHFEIRMVGARGGTADGSSLAACVGAVLPFNPTSSVPRKPMDIVHDLSILQMMATQGLTSRCQTLIKASACRVTLSHGALHARGPHRDGWLFRSGVQFDSTHVTRASSGRKIRLGLVHASNGESPEAPSTSLSPDEAYMVLGLATGATFEEVVR